MNSFCTAVDMAAAAMATVLVHGDGWSVAPETTLGRHPKGKPRVRRTLGQQQSPAGHLAMSTTVA
jgi:hypothetical protein